MKITHYIKYTFFFACHLFAISLQAQTRTLNQSLAVGTAPGTINVSTSGAANYSMPIIVPPGTGGLQPALSLNYNSQGNNGIMGKGWDVSGFSLISRSPQNMRYNNNTNAVQLNASDGFDLDGNRLIVTNGLDYGSNNAEYCTANESFVKVTSFGTSGSGPRWFQVKTKDGKTLEYGNSANAILQASGSDEIIFWYLSKVTDINGNYITYTYHTNRTTGEFWPEKIEYTGNTNTGVTPYNAVAFTYQSRPDTILSYIGGNKISLNVLLSSVKVYSETTLVREYQLAYNSDNGSHLVSVTPLGKNNESLNATVFNWGEFPYTDLGAVSGSRTGYLNGDFNGDGLPEAIPYSPFDLLDRKLRGLPTLGISRAVAGDFNGDGKDDVVDFASSSFNYYQSRGIRYQTEQSQGTRFQSGQSRNCDSVSISSYININDFNGDGIEDLFVVPHDGPVLVYWGSSTVPLNNSSLFSYSGQYYIGDFNGDSRTEILVRDETSGIKVCSWNGNSFVVNYSAETPTTEELYTGDFNGDGKLDFAYINYLLPYTPKKLLQYRISTGKGFTSQQIKISSFASRIVASDLNKDKQDEIILVDDGDVIVKSYLYKNNALTDYTEGTLSNATRLLVTSISNGLNMSTSISYNSALSDAVYLPDTVGSYGKINYMPSELLVSSITSDNGSSGQNQLVYYYNGMKFNNQYNEVLGFSKITCTNSVLGLKNINYFEVNDTYKVNAIKKSETRTLSDQLLSETNYTTQYNNQGTNRLFGFVSKQVSIDYLHENTTNVQSFAYDAYGNLTRHSIKNNNDSVVTSRSYINAGSWCLNKAESITSTSVRTGVPSYTTSSSYSYYPNGLLQQEIKEPGNPKQVYTNYTYDAFGNVTQVKVSPNGTTGRITNFQYEPGKGRMVTRRSNELNHYIDYTNDYALGVVTRTSDNNDLTATSRYDNFGNLTGITNADGTTSGTSVNWVTGSGAPLNARYYTTSQASGVPSVTTYFDVLGRQLQSETTGFDGRKLITKTAYTSKGQVDYITLPYYEGDASSDRKSYTYDSFGRVLTETAPGVNLQYTYNGLSVTVTDHIKGVSTTRLANADGSLQKVTDAGGDITYSYFANGLTKQISSPGGNNISMTYDQFGRQVSLTDPNTGTYTYDYNIYGELTSQTDPKSRVTTIGYNNLGQPTYCNQGTFNTSYTYKTNGLPESVSASNNISYTYSYGDYLRPAATTENIEGVTLSTGYAYNADGTVSKVTYPGGFAVTYHYRNGYLEEIKRADTGASIWKVNAMNARGQITQTTAGNGLVTTKTYNTNGYLTAINTGSGSIQNLEYHYNAKDLMDLRRDKRRITLIESFGYDALNRLNTITMNGVTKSIDYAANGNIQTKTDAGTYTYSATRPNAVEKVSGNAGSISRLQQDITYTTFNKVNSLTEGTSSATFTYGPDYARKKVVTNVGGTTTTRLYSGSYERETQGSITRELYYIVAGGEIVAIFEKKTGAADAMHYVHTDHLGSLNVITNQGGTIEQELSFDAWGNRRSPDTWENLTGTPANLLTRRGFTGHEHMDEFGIINMNGRMYDPVLGRFLSPDNYVQAPGFTQSYNRYSYCVNNPLLFTDPSGMRFVRNQTVCANMDLSYGGGGGGLSGSYLGLEGRMFGGLFSSLGGLGANTSLYTYDWRSGSYIETATGEIVPSLKAINWLFSISKNRAEAVKSASDEIINITIDANGWLGITGVFGGKAKYIVIHSCVYYHDYSLSPSYADVNLNPASSGGGGVPGWMSDANTGINAFGVANSAKTELIDYAIRSNYKSATSWSQFNKLRATQQAWRTTNTIGKTGAQYLKYAKGLGYVGAGLTTAYSVTSAYNYYNSGGSDWSVYAKSGLDIVMTGVGFLGPIGFGISAAYFIIDASTDSFGGFGKINP